MSTPRPQPKPPRIKKSMPRLDPSRIVTHLVLKFGTSFDLMTDEDGKLYDQIVKLLAPHMSSASSVSADLSSIKEAFRIVPLHAASSDDIISEEKAAATSANKKKNPSNNINNARSKEPTIITIDPMDSLSDDDCDYSNFDDPISSSPEPNSESQNKEPEESSHIILDHDYTPLRASGPPAPKVKKGLPPPKGPPPLPPPLYIIPAKPDIPLTSLEKAYRYWTKQSLDPAVPLIVRNYIKPDMRLCRKGTCSSGHRLKLSAVYKKFSTVKSDALFAYQRELLYPDAVPLLEKIEKYVYEKFRDLYLKEELPIIDQNFYDWGNDAWKLLDPESKICPWFKASTKWMDDFRRKYRIPSARLLSGQPKAAGKSQIEVLLEEAKNIQGNLMPQESINLEPETREFSNEQTESPSEPKTSSSRKSTRKRVPNPPKRHPDFDDLSSTDYSDLDSSTDEEGDEESEEDADYDPDHPFPQKPYVLPLNKQILENIYVYVHEKFETSKGTMIVRDKTIQAWGREAQEIYDPGPERVIRFKASKSWLKAFKQRYGIILKEVYNRPRNPNSVYWKLKARKKAAKEKAEKEAQEALGAMEHSTSSRESQAAASDLKQESTEQPMDLLEHEPLDLDNLEHHFGVFPSLSDSEILQPSALSQFSQQPNDTLSHVVQSTGISTVTSDSLLKQQLAAAQQQIAAYQAQISAYQQLFAQPTAITNQMQANQGPPQPINQMQAYQMLVPMAQQNAFFATPSTTSLTNMPVFYHHNYT